MEFRFDPEQEHQVQAIDSVVRLFEGQPRQEAELEFAAGGGFATVKNRLLLPEEALLENLQAVQRSNDLPVDDALELIEEEDDLSGGAGKIRFPNFSVEMETGTGKTYAYLRTALELHERFGFRKYIIVVPFVAIREGVLKTLRMTRDHFRSLYDNVPYRFYPYDSSNLAQVRNFALSDSVEFMVMTLASFNKAMGKGRSGNVIYRPDDRLQGETPVDLIRETQPVLILDEPQNMESEKSVKALSALNPSFALRYSATHRRSYNVVYRLDPYEAYRRGLVKRVEVAGVEEEDANRPFLRLDEIRTGKRSVSARLQVQCLLQDGTLKKRSVTVRGGDDLEEATGNPVYEGLVVSEIDARKPVVRFVDGTELGPGRDHGPDKDVVFDAQIRYTVEEHLKKQARLREHGIKVLSLFFIDRVDNYASEDPVIRRLFNRAFDEIKQDYEAWEDLDPEEVQAAYFASRTTRAGETIYEDSKTGEAQRDEEAYDLIMRDKESLLSFPREEDSPEARRKKRVSFIFSHSALREGWDNPNLFQICTLNESVSEMRKRQEIGRGIRLAVDQSGRRVHDEDVNVLTVVANESYEYFVEKYQRELDREFGTEGVPPKPTDARTSKTARIRRDRLAAEGFQELWKRIGRKSRFEVELDTEDLLETAAAALEGLGVRPPRVVIGTAELVADEEDRFDYRVTRYASEDLARDGAPGLPNLVERITGLMQEATPPIRLARSTLLRTLRSLSCETLGQALENPQEFAIEAARRLRRVLEEQMVEGIRYQESGERYDTSGFLNEIERPEGRLREANRSLYDHVQVDSDVEREFVDGLERWDAVDLYLKLPRWYTVETPVGEYNPDWALVVSGGGEDRDDGRRLYLVRETKSSEYGEDLRTRERFKVECGRRHFVDALDVDYDVATSASEVMDDVARRDRD